MSSDWNPTPGYPSEWPDDAGNPKPERSWPRLVLFGVVIPAGLLATRWLLQLLGIVGLAGNDIVGNLFATAAIYMFLVGAWRMWVKATGPKAPPQRDPRDGAS